MNLLCVLSIVVLFCSTSVESAEKCLSVILADISNDSLGRLTLLAESQQPWMIKRRPPSNPDNNNNDDDDDLKIWTKPSIEIPAVKNTKGQKKGGMPSGGLMVGDIWIEPFLLLTLGAMEKCLQQNQSLFEFRLMKEQVRIREPLCWYSRPN